MTRNNNGIPKFVEERDPTPIGDNLVSLGKMVVYYHIGSKRLLNEDKSLIGFTYYRYKIA